MIKQICIVLFAGAALMSSCGKGDNKKLLIGKWYGVAQDIPQLDSILKGQMQFLDTVGQSTSPEEEVMLYGTSNLDSLIREEKAALDLLLNQQESYMKDTKIEFRKDEVVVFNFSGDTDSANWYYNDDGDLVFDAMKLKGAGEKVLMQVLHISDTALQLQFHENEFNGSIRFHREKEAK